MVGGLVPGLFVCPQVRATAVRLAVVRGRSSARCPGTGPTIYTANDFLIASTILMPSSPAMQPFQARCQRTRRRARPSPRQGPGDCRGRESVDCGSRAPDHPHSTARVLDRQGRRRSDWTGGSTIAIFPWDRSSHWRWKTRRFASGSPCWNNRWQPSGSTARVATDTRTNQKPVGTTRSRGCYEGGTFHAC